MPEQRGVESDKQRSGARAARSGLHGQAASLRPCPCLQKGSLRGGRETTPLNRVRCVMSGQIVQRSLHAPREEHWPRMIKLILRGPSTLNSKDVSNRNEDWLSSTRQISLH